MDTRTYFECVTPPLNNSGLAFGCISFAVGWDERAVPLHALIGSSVLQCCPLLIFCVGVLDKWIRGERRPGTLRAVKTARTLWISRACVEVTSIASVSSERSSANSGAPCTAPLLRENRAVAELGLSNTSRARSVPGGRGSDKRRSAEALYL
jgi:hypothetical protein